MVLTSGHGILPFGQNGRIVQHFVKEDHPPVEVTINDGSGGFYTGRLVAGALAGGRRVDFGVIRIGGMSDGDHDAWHAATSSLPPHTARATPVTRGEVVWHISRFGNRPQRVLGRLNAEALGSVDVRLPDGAVGKYSGVLRVQATSDLPFSIAGESGGLVVDEQQLVVGTVLAGLTDRQSYVLPIGALIEALGRVELGGLFF